MRRSTTAPRHTALLLGLALLALVAREVPRAHGDEDPPASSTHRAELVVQLGHGSLVNAVAFSPDGRHLLTGSDDGTACLWEVETGAQVRRFEGHEKRITCVAFHPSGTRVLTGSDDETARLWDVTTGREVHRFEGHEDNLVAVACSCDGAYLLTGTTERLCVWDEGTGRELQRVDFEPFMVTALAFAPADLIAATAMTDGSVALWDLARGTEIRRLEGIAESIASVAISPDGAHVLAGYVQNVFDEEPSPEADRAVAYLWETATGRVVHQLVGGPGSVDLVAFSPDGSRAFTNASPLYGPGEYATRLWDVATGKEVGRLEGGFSQVAGVAFSPDGRHLVAACSDWTTRLWDAGSGAEIRRFTGRGLGSGSAVFTPDGARLLTGWEDGVARSWDLLGGDPSRLLQSHGGGLRSVVFTPDAGRAMTCAYEGSAGLWDVATRTELGRFEGHEEKVDGVALSSGGTRLATGSGDHARYGDDGSPFDNSARLWDVATRRELRRFEGHELGVCAVAFSPDDSILLTGSYDGTARLWDVATGQELRQFKGPSMWVKSVAFTPDGAQVVTGHTAGHICLWDVATGKELRRFTGHGDGVTSLVFSADGTQLLTASWDHTARIFDFATGREIQHFTGHRDSVWWACFSPDGTHVATCSVDNTVRVWEVATGRALCSLIAFEDDSWVVVDEAGRYDASHGGDVEGLHWVVGLETIALDQLKNRYYDPGLLAKHLGRRDEPLRDVAAFEDVKLYPKVDVEPPTAERPRVGIRLANRGGGIGRVVVLVNGKEVEADARGGRVRPDQAEARIDLDLAGDPRVRAGEVNTLQVLAYNAEGYLRSRGPKIAWEAPGKSVADPPELWAVVCGVSDYRTEAIDLRYADKDAEAFASALRLAAGELFGEDRVHLTLLSTSGADGALRPTRVHLEQAFASARAAGPDDLLVVYLSGHGVNLGGQDGDYHYLLAEAASADLSDPAVRQATSVSSAELTEWIKAVPATKRQVLILDTCAAGRLAEKLTEARNVPSSQRRALERVKDRTGMFVLAGCASDRVSYEATRYGQGLLTYSLLLGMRGGALRDEEYVDVQSLFGFAADRVPSLASDIGGIQRPVIAQPKEGASFDIGRLPPAVRDRIPLQDVKPVFVRSSFHDTRRHRDTLSLERAVDGMLRAATARGGGAPVVFVDAREMPESYQLTGGYVVKDDVVHATVILWRGDAEMASYEVEGAADDVDALATHIVRQARTHLR